MTGQKYGATRVSDESQGAGIPKVAATDAEQAESSTAETVEGEETTAEGEQPKKTPWFQKRIDELTAARRDAERREAALNDRLMGLLEQRTQPEAPKVGKPVLENFESYEDYTEALTDWKVDQKIGQVEQRRQAETAAQTQAREQAEFNERVQSVAAKAPEVLELVNDSTLPISEAMAAVIKSDPKGPELLLHLGANRAEAKRIAQLPAYQAAYELGRLSAGMTPAAQPRKNTPPAPIPPLGGGGSAAPTDPNKFANADEYEAWRRADLKAKGIR